MGLGHSPRIVTDGMVLCLDAANPKNYNLTAVEVLVVAGGGGGGMDMGGGGGGGGVIYSSAVSITPGSAITATVGNGGVGAPAAGTNGQPGGHQYTIPATQGGNSVFGALTAIGGGFGGSSYRGYTPGIAGGSGGSGGGASGYNDNAGTFLGGLGTSGQGNRGGNSTAAYYSGGGGGAGAPGADSTNQPNGGVGVENSILGVSYFWGGGGGGGGYSIGGGNGGNGGGGGGAVGATTGGSGLNAGFAGGGGGTGGNPQTPGGNAGANTGGGGGGGSHYNANNKGGEGGSGIIIVRYPGPQKAIGGTVTSVGGYTIHTFTTSGNFTPLVNTNGSAVLGLSDLSGNRNFGTSVNGVTYSSANGGSLSFDGTNDSIDIPVSPSLQSQFFTFNIWFRMNTFPGAGTPLIMSHYQSYGTVSGLTVFEYQGKYWFQTRFNNSCCQNLQVGTPAINTWTNFVGTWDGSIKTAYLDGIEVGTQIASGTHYQLNNFSIGNNSDKIAAGNYSQSANGDISSVTYYNRALTAQEIQQNFNALRGRFGL